MTRLRKIPYWRRVTGLGGTGLVLLLVGVPAMVVPPLGLALMGGGLGFLVAAPLVAAFFHLGTFVRVADCPVCGGLVKTRKSSGGCWCRSCKSRLVIRGGTVTPAGL